MSFRKQFELENVNLIAIIRLAYKNKFEIEMHIERAFVAWLENKLIRLNLIMENYRR